MSDRAVDLPIVVLGALASLVAGAIVLSGQHHRRIAQAALMLILTAPFLAACGTSTTCSRGLRLAQQQAASEYRQQLRIHDPHAQQIAILSGQSSLLQWDYDHKTSCTWDRAYSPARQQ